jgi:hypothetical protein
MQIMVAGGPLPIRPLSARALSDLPDRTSHLLRFLAKQLLPLDAGHVKSVRRSVQNGRSGGPLARRTISAASVAQNRRFGLSGLAAFGLAAKRQAVPWLQFGDVLFG